MSSWRGTSLSTGKTLPLPLPLALFLQRMSETNLNNIRSKMWRRDFMCTVPDASG
jgi:hypothetical protein